MSKRATESSALGFRHSPTFQVKPNILSRPRRPNLVRPANISTVPRLGNVFLIAIGLRKIRSVSCVCGGGLGPYGICSMRFRVKAFSNWDVGLEDLLERFCVRRVASAQSQLRPSGAKTGPPPRFLG